MGWSETHILLKFNCQIFIGEYHVFIAIEMLLIFVCTAGLYGTEIKQYKHRVTSLSHKQYSV